MAVKVVAILCSDIHLSHRAPIARSAEPDWYAAMARPLRELRELQQEYDCPVICAGDIFDHWKSPPELINFALESLPEKMYAIPGQHDLPNHVYEDMRKSAYGTLVAAGKISNVPSNSWIIDENLVLHGFPWGNPLKRRSSDSLKIFLHVAVVHAYIWKTGCSYPNAPKESRWSSFREKLKGYNVAVFGDNHKGFNEILEGTRICNCGGFMRRKIDEIDYRPSVGILNSSGGISLHHLDCSEDKFIDVTRVAALTEDVLDMESFLRELAELGDAGLNFIESMEQFVARKDIAKRTRQIIAEALHGKSE